ncbi:MAG: heavy-metal-associated domain-containing protein [Myxococcales bacterium]|jgi:copper chaperone CopZ|nr:heavy-metal-associated domain-containing protein [Myxococcales bacterium]MBL0194198.1 heavy-metal-associated domain-containing protein [Myxococcales bacterium]HQY60017.1 heavy metal-associated domain-containing protein [Polyangiaceae bacterium]
MPTIVLNIEGMTCGGCVKAVQNVLGRLEGAEVVEVSVGRAVLRFGSAWGGDSSPAVAAIAKAGFTARVAEPAGDATR